MDQTVKETFPTPCRTHVRKNSESERTGVSNPVLEGAPNKVIILKDQGYISCNATNHILLLNT